MSAFGSLITHFLVSEPSKPEWRLSHKLIWLEPAKRTFEFPTKDAATWLQAGLKLKVYSQLWQAA